MNELFSQSIARIMLYAWALLALAGLSLSGCAVKKAFSDFFSPAPVYWPDPQGIEIISGNPIGL